MSDIPEDLRARAVEAGHALRCSQCGNRYVDLPTCGPTHAILRREVTNAPYLSAELVEARTALAESVAREQQLRDAIQSLHGPKRLHPELRFRPWCDECSTGIVTHGDDGTFTHRVHWPCPTAVAAGLVDPLAAVPSPAVTPEPRPGPVLRDVPRLPATAALDHCGTCHRPLPHNEVESHACPTVPVETTEDR